MVCTRPLESSFDVMKEEDMLELSFNQFLLSLNVSNIELRVRSMYNVTKICLNFK